MKADSPVSTNGSLMVTSCLLVQVGCWGQGHQGLGEGVMAGLAWQALRCPSVGNTSPRPSGTLFCFALFPTQ